jgi:hypothetical protein
VSFAEFLVSIFVAGPDNDRKYYVTISLLDTERDIAPAKIIGMLNRPIQRGESITSDNFARNDLFVDFLHNVIFRHGPTLPGLVQAAKTQRDGWVNIIDVHTPTPLKTYLIKISLEHFKLIMGTFICVLRTQCRSPDSFSTRFLSARCTFDLTINH